LPHTSFGSRICGVNSVLISVGRSFKGKRLLCVRGVIPDRISDFATRARAHSPFSDFVQVAAIEKERSSDVRCSL
jgi:hypothetical protein